jgi:Zn finger protein HypA/HybF involved in hydrogenase expression
MGGRMFKCEDCHETTSLYNSCGDRHCPACSGSKRVDFNEKAAKLIIDGVVYYQVVMTLPSELSELALSNRELLGGLLPKSAWSSLGRSIRTEQGYKAAAISVLHTWNQQLTNHWHVHLLVPGAGPSVEGDRWVEATPPTGSRNDHGFYLVDADTLRTRFRKTLLRRLARARAAGKLKLTGRHAYLQDDDNWTAFVNGLAAKTWVAYIQPPPPTESKAHHVVNYLTRYLTGGPISDHRIVSANRQSVTFLAREGKQVGGRRTQVPITISTQEFTQRWSEHIQPNHLTKVRYFGGWSNSKVGQYMRRCRDLSSATTRATAAEPDPQNADPQNADPQQADLICEHCGSDRMVLQSESSPPSWRELLGYGSSASPPWYATLRNESDRIFWDGLMGEGFNAWYLETLIESAKETELQPSPPRQMHLPGFEPPDPYLLYSF